MANRPWPGRGAPGPRPISLLRASQRTPGRRPRTGGGPCAPPIATRKWTACAWAVRTPFSKRPCTDECLKQSLVSFLSANSLGSPSYDLLLKICSRQCTKQDEIGFGRVLLFILPLMVPPPSAEFWPPRRTNQIGNGHGAPRRAMARPGAPRPRSGVPRHSTARPLRTTSRPRIRGSLDAARSRRGRG